MNEIYHIAQAEGWKLAQDSDYRPESLVREGFIHCSAQDQVLRSAENYYKGCSGLVLLKIDPAKLLSELVWENTTGGTEPFPHLYGPLNLDAVVDLKPLLSNDQGCFVFPYNKV